MRDESKGVQIPVVVFGDLDDTLFQTLRKCPPGAEVFPVAYDRAGEPLSYATAKQQRLFQWLTADAEFVPVTGRNAQAVARVQLPFDRYAISSFGGVILTPGGEPHAEWAAHIEAQSRALNPLLEALCRDTLALAGRLGVDLRATPVTDHDMPLYLSIKHNQADAEALERFAHSLREMDGYPASWRMHLNGNNLACLPPYLAKEHAVRFFMDHIAPAGALTVGFGDSHSDAPYIALCDYAMTPTHTPLGRHLHTVRAYVHAD